MILAAMAALNGVLTDYNSGSIIRTVSESLGATVEEQGAELSTLVYESIVYGAFTAYGITPYSATAAVGQITFLTSTSASPPPASQSVLIPSGTIVQTVGGTQFLTTQSVTLQSGLSSISVGIQALVAGTNGNVVASAITQISNGLGYPLFCLNASPTAGGAAAEPFAQTAARFAAAVGEPGLASPQAVADAAMGVTFSGTSETVLYSSVWESGIASGIAGFILYVDNGTGSASSGLISAVSAKLNTAPMYRPAGVPYSIQAVNPVLANVAITGTIFSQYESNSASIVSSLTSGVDNYFTLAFSQTAYQGAIAAAAGNATLGQLSSLTVSLNSGATTVSAAPGQRVILNTLSLNVS